ncbi:class I SAM-dependent methyltransferase [Candidatus Omnitrophota bacterium]
MRQRESVEVWYEFWDRRKEDYLRENFRPWNRLVWEVGLEYWTKRAGLAKGKRTLECGCGSAEVSRHLAKNGYDATMLDISRDGLKIAEMKFAQYGLKGTFVMGNVKKIGFADNSFDIVMSFGILEHFEDVRPVIKEMVRVLKPGGVFLADIIPRKFSCQDLANIEIFIALFLKRLFTFCFKNIIKESCPSTTFYENCIPKKEYKKIMEESGLCRVKITGTRPFPPLALPRCIEKVYVWILRRLRPFWDWFDECESGFTDFWGLGWYSFGVKKDE